jgi:predicted amidohydrolase
MRVGLVQMTSGDTPSDNLSDAMGYIDHAVAQGAQFILTPEVTNCLSLDRAHQARSFHLQDDDPSLAAFRAKAKTHGIWLLIGSLALLSGDPDGRFANRSFLIGPDGTIAAQYDKIHMFDVDVSETESFRESDGYRPGSEAVLATTDFAKIGMTICYDLRFPHLYRALAHAGAQILTVPAAFSPVTGRDHWQPLLQARAIETGCFVLAPAQTGDHGCRKTHGHSMVIDPWGRVLLDAGTDVGVSVVDLDLDDVAKMRRRVPSLSHDQEFTVKPCQIVKHL